MSIATEEAEKKYPAFSGDMKRRSLNMPFHIGYVNGRTAPVTEAEIEAAARELWRDAFYRRARHFGVVQDFDDLTDEVKWNLRCSVRAMLSAARKQVSDE